MYAEAEALRSRWEDSEIDDSRLPGAPPPDADSLRIGLDIRVADPVEPGQQRYLWRLGRWLGLAGHEVHYLTVKRQRPEREAPAGTTLHNLAPLSRRALRRYVAGLRLDALLLNPERSARYRGIRTNILRSAYGTEQYRQKLRSFTNPVEQSLRRLARRSPWVTERASWERAFYEAVDPPPRVLAQSTAMRREILSSYDVPEENVHVVYNPVDASEFSTTSRQTLRDEARARWSIPRDAVCLLFLGHNFRLKGLWQLLRVTGRPDLARSNLRLLVAGKGTGRAQRRKAKRLIGRHGLRARVTLTGPVRPPLPAFAAADALVHLSWHDSFGFAPLEAMACGLPVVTTCYAGVSELIRHGHSGLIVDPSRDDDIAGAIHALLDPEVRERLGHGGGVTAAAHDEPANFARVLDVIREAVAAHGRPIGGPADATAVASRRSSSRRSSRRRSPARRHPAEGR